LYTSSRDVMDRPFPKFNVTSPKAGARNGTKGTSGGVGGGVMKGQPQRSQSAGKIRIPTATSSLSHTTAVRGNKGKSSQQQQQQSSRIVSVMK
jgi:hypothetical protein